MCTTISGTAAVRGAGRGERGWFELRQATVAFDHATQGDAEHALLLDFANYELGTESRVAVELNLESGRALLELLSEALAAASDGEFKE